MEIQITEKSTDMAAALGTLGAVITPARVIDAATRQDACFFKITGPCLKNVNPDKLRRDYRAGKLPPGHLLRKCHLAFRNRTAFLTFMSQGGGIEHVLGPDGWELHLRGTAGLPGIPTGSIEPMIRSNNLKNVLALITAGHPPMKMEGEPGRFYFTLRSGGPEGMAPQLLHQLRNAPDSFTNDSTLHVAHQALANRERLLKLIPEVLGHIIVKPPVGPRRVILPQNASPKAWDKAKKFLIG
jgi:hypothetical protein